MNTTISPETTTDEGYRTYSATDVIDMQAYIASRARVPIIGTPTTPELTNHQPDPQRGALLAHEAMMRYTKMSTSPDGHEAPEDADSPGVLMAIQWIDGYPRYSMYWLVTRAGNAGGPRRKKHDASPTATPTAPTNAAPKRGRGRPKGSKNITKGQR